MDSSPRGSTGSEAVVMERWRSRGHFVFDAVEMSKRVRTPAVGASEGCPRGSAPLQWAQVLDSPAAMPAAASRAQARCAASAVTCALDT